MLSVFECLERDKAEFLKKVQQLYNNSPEPDFSVLSKWLN